MDNAPTVYIIGLFALGAVTFYDRWRNKSNDSVRVSSEVIDTYKTQVQQLREELADEKKGRIEDRHKNINEIGQLKLQLEYMKGQQVEKDKKITELNAIIQGISPEDEQYRKDMRIFTAGVAQFMENSAKWQKESSEILIGMKTFMTQLNDKSTINQDRNIKIDAKERIANTR